MIKKIRNDEYLRILGLRTLGNFILITSLFLLFKTFVNPVREEVRYFLDNQVAKKYIVGSGGNLDKIKITDADSSRSGFLAKTFSIKPIEVLRPVDPDFSVIIPKIGANARVIKDVDPADEKIYLAALNHGVAQALGSAYPGQGGHIFLFAHSTDYFWNVGTYNAIFYLLYKLEKDDEIDLFYQGQRYVYKVIGREIVNPSEVQYLTRQSNREFLTLQTCWPLGTTLKRLLVFASRVAE